MLNLDRTRVGCFWGVLGLLLTLVGLLIVSAQVSQAQWEPDVRLTNDPAWSSTSLNNSWCIAASGNIVHVVWLDNRDGNREIYYKRSTDAGLTWGPDIRLTNNPARSLHPSIAVSGEIVHVVWTDERDGNFEIYYKRSTDAGLTWGPDIRLTNNPDYSFLPSIAVSGEVVHIVWTDERDGNFEIYYKRSTDAGLTWELEKQLSRRLEDLITLSSFPSVAVSERLVHVVWMDDPDEIGKFEIYHRRSKTAGLTWRPDRRLTDIPVQSLHPSVAVSGKIVHIVWVDERNGNWEIYYKRSTDAGLTWGPDIRLTNNPAPSNYPSIAVSGEVVHIVWVDRRDKNSEIYYKRSTDAGLTWGPDIRLTNNPAPSNYPSVAVSGEVIHVVWMDKRNGNPEIYYKRNPKGNH